MKTERELIKTRQKRRQESERRAIECMRSNPKMFYSIINNQKNRKNEVEPCKVDEEIIDDAETIVEKLLMEYKSQFSKTRREKRKIYS